MTEHTEIIFVCEFGSKKSVLAAAWLAELAAQRGVELKAVSRGIRPDAEVPGRIRAELLSHGIDIGDVVPTMLSVEDCRRAHLVVSFTEEPLASGSAVVKSWADIPALSDDFEVAAAQIRERVAALLDELRLLES